jgi:hypothetical protein
MVQKATGYEKKPEPHYTAWGSPGCASRASRHHPNVISDPQIPLTRQNRQHRTGKSQGQVHISMATVSSQIPSKPPFFARLADRAFPANA